MASNNGIVNRLRGFDAKHYAATDRYARIIEKLFNMASDELAQAARNASYDPSAVFSFNDLPATRRQAQQILSRLVGQLEHVIDNGTKAEWLAACDKNDAFINAILRSSKLSRAEVEQYEDRNLEALRAFQNRKTNGLGLSHRVWNYAGNFVNEVELGIDAALGDGTPAANLARSLRQHLKEPERIYRRFRIKTGEDENGNPIYGREWKRREYDPETGTFRWVKDDPADYHPGTGVYRSSVKNTMRLARTEINMAYREAEYLRWQQLDFVVGFRVCLSNNHTIINPKTGKKEPLTDICDELAGDYPKTFKFLGWHPNCRCYVVPIMEDYDEYNKRRAGRLKAIVRRESYTSLPSRRQVTDVPPNFRKYIESIADRSRGWKTQPYYIRDNFVGGRIAGGLKPTIPTKTMNDVQPCTDFDAEIAALRRWAYAFGLDLSNIDALRTSGNRTELKAAVDTIKATADQRYDEWQRERNNLYNYINSGEGKQDKIIVELCEGILNANEIDPKNYYTDSIAKLKQALIDAKEAIKRFVVKPKPQVTITPTAEQKKNLTDLETALGVKRGTNMTYEEADKGKENPNYSKERGYKINCQTCTVTHLLRRLGFNVEAKPNNKIKVGGKTKESAYHEMEQQGITWEERFLNQDGTKPDYDYTKDWSRRKGYSVMTTPRLEEYLTEKLAADGIYEIYCAWKRGGAHVFLAEVVGGKIRYFDPQSGSQDVKSYISRMMLGLVGIIRIDNKLINPKIKNLFVTK